MRYTITVGDRVGVAPFRRETARRALEKWLELERVGLQFVTVKDDKGYQLTHEQLKRLCPLDARAPASSIRCAPTPTRSS
jgi:hypothetical protein